MLKPTKRKNKVLTAVVALLAAALVGSGATVAHAHDQLVVSDPAHNSVVDQSPEQLTLTFNNQILDVEGASILELRDSADKVLIDAVPKVSGTDLTQVISDPLAEGVYRVVWRVVSSDGHPIEGSFNFGVGKVSESDLTALPQGRNLASNAITLDSQASGGDSAANSASDSADSADSNDSTRPQDVYAIGEGEDAGINAGGVLLASFGVLALAAIITVTVIWWMRQSRSNDTKN